MAKGQSLGFRVSSRDRELNLALDQINAFQKANPSKKVILIFGKDHEAKFKLHAGKFPPECMIKPPDFIETDPPKIPLLPPPIEYPATAH